MSGPGPAIELVEVGTRLGGKVIHESIDLTVQRGEVLALVGGSGSGKTTLLREIIGLQRATSGRITVLGQDLAEASASDWEELRRRWGVLFQGGALFTNLTVFENVALPLQELRVLDATTVDELVLQKIVAVGLAPEDSGKLPAELSGGMVKRAGLARALALEPELLLLDEPTSGLDPVASDSFVQLVDSLRRQLDLTVLLITHDLDTLADLCDRVAVLADRTLVAVGPVAEVAQVDHPFVQEFFGGRRGARALAPR
ncbi:MAG TPA: ATP-binding cassette domain-containing protein [Thermoanaerobaculia bacterium]|nr:ATP-binding cassette domain-containing protein [Thermoanaerobaculia bacterium]